MAGRRRAGAQHGGQRHRHAELCLRRDEHLRFGAEGICVMMEEENKTGWRIDHRVPLTLIVTLLIQAGAALIWATQLDARVNQMEEQSINGSVIDQKFVGLEQRLDDMKQDLLEVKRQLNRLMER